MFLFFVAVPIVVLSFISPEYLFNATEDCGICNGGVDDEGKIPVCSTMSVLSLYISSNTAVTYMDLQCYYAKNISCLHTSLFLGILSLLIYKQSTMAISFPFSILLTYFGHISLERLQLRCSTCRVGFDAVKYAKWHFSRHYILLLFHATA